MPDAAAHDHGITPERAGLGVLAIGLVGLVILPSVPEHVAPSDASLIVTYAAAAVGTAGAMFVEIAGRLIRHPRAVWLSAALALYSVVVIPFATVHTVFGRDGLTLSVARLVAYWTVVLLLVLALRPPRAVSGSRSWVLAGCGLLLTLGTAEMATPALGAIRLAPSPSVAQIAWFVTACSLVAALVANGWQERKGPLRRVSPGLLVIAAAHLYWVVGAWVVGGFRAAEPNAAFSVPRLFGLALVLLAAVQLARRAWRAVHVEHSTQQTELKVHLERMTHDAVERDHELRNGLASLAGAHLLLDKSLDSDQAKKLRRAVASELRRLETMLERPGLSATPDWYLIAPVLTDLVTLRRSAGRDVELDVDEQLRARGSPEVLAQVVTNLLANCERHASGSAVRVSACRDQDRVLIEVADEGPGIPAELRRIVLDRGVRGSRSNGSGLGLHICRQLLEAQHGTLRMIAPRSGHSGCSVLIELPAALECPQSVQSLGR